MKTTNESGRSMVEMLGVLAIIGVLSIGGIAGYSMAMNRYRANEALDAASKLAVVVFAGAQTYAATHGSTDGYSSSIPTLYDAGLTAGTKTGSGSNITITGKSKTPGGVSITATAVDDSGVTISLDFGSSGENVCKAAASILGVTNGCSSNKLSHVFKQS